jgi:hypothetical protein
MKSYLLIALLVTVGSVNVASGEDPSPNPTSTPVGSNCNKQSWSPEMHTFYGSKDVILEKLGNWSAKPSEHRVFVQITQGPKGGDVKFFERSGSSGSYTVTEWSALETSKLVEALDKAIMANKGVNCVGEQMKAVLEKLGKGTKTNDVAEPASVSAAFSHAVKEASSDFIKTVIIFGC